LLFADCCSVLAKDVPWHLLPESFLFHNVISAIPCIGFDVLADKICSVHSNTNPQHASAVTAVLATTQLTTMQTMHNADNDAGVDEDNKNATQMTDDNGQGCK
jgi:hypothetical protein